MRKQHRSAPLCASSTRRFSRWSWSDWEARICSPDRARYLARTPGQLRWWWVSVRGGLTNGTRSPAVQNVCLDKAAKHHGNNFGARQTSPSRWIAGQACGQVQYL